MKEELLKSWKSRSRENIKKYKIFLNRIDKAKAIRILPVLHHEAFKKIDCLDCAACCKNYSPRFKQQDIKRIARSLNMKERDFELTYLVSDEDHDFVLQSKPCPFLEKDNKCQIYDVRPSDCHRSSCKCGLGKINGNQITMNKNCMAYQKCYTFKH